MSDVIRSVFLNYIVCAVFGGVLEYLTPQKMRKTIRVCVVSLILLTSVVPLFKVDIDFKGLYSSEELEIQAQYNALMRTANIIEKNVYAEMKQILINQDVDEYEIYVSTEINEEDNVVYLEAVRIEVDHTYKSKIPHITNDVPREYRQIFKIGVKNE